MDRSVCRLPKKHKYAEFPDKPKVERQKCCFTRSSNKQQFHSYFHVTINSRRMKPERDVLIIYLENARTKSNT